MDKLTDMLGIFQNNLMLFELVKLNRKRASMS